MFRQILVVAAVFVLSQWLLRGLGMDYPGPVAVVVSLLAASWLLHREGSRWSALGLCEPRSWPRLGLAALGYTVLAYLVAASTTVVATRVLGWPSIDISRVADLHGNVPALLGMLAISWSTAAFGEELLFRGFLQTRIERLLGAGRGAAVAAALLQGLVFGIGHAYQGLTGVLVTGALGVLLGLLYLRGRNLWPLIIAHGLIDSLSMFALYAGLRPPG